MDELRRVTSQAARRIVLERFGCSGGWWACAGAGAGLIGIVVVKAAGFAWLFDPERAGMLEERPWLWGAWMLAAGTIGGAAGAVAAISRRPNSLAAARRVDERLQLQDRVSAGVDLSGGGPEASRRSANDPFARVAIEDARSAASAVVMTGAIRPRAGGSWLWAAAVVAIGSAIGIWSPMLTPAARRAQQARRDLVTERAVAAADIQRTISEVKRSDPSMGVDGRESDPASREAVLALEQIEQELRGDGRSSVEARRQAAAALSDAADKIQQDVAGNEQEVRDVQAALSRLARREGPTQSQGASGLNRDSAAERLTKALQSSDFASAKQAADELLNPANGDVSDTRNAQALEQLAHDLDEISRDNAPGNGSQAMSKPRDRAAQSGADSTRNQPDELAHPEVLNRQPDDDRRAGGSNADEPAEVGDSSNPSTSPRDKSPAPETSEPPTARLAERLREAAKELRERARETSGDEKAVESKPRDADQPVNGDRSNPSTDNQRHQSGDPSTTRKSDDARSARSSDSQTPSSGEGQQRSTDPDSKPEDTASQRVDERKPERPSGQSREASSPRNRSASGPNDQASKLRRESGSSRPVTKDGEHKASDNSSTDSNPAQTPGEIPKPTEQGVKRLADELERLAKAPRDAQSRRENAQELRRRAQELVDRATPEQRERLRQWQDALARQNQQPDGSNSPENRSQSLQQEARREMSDASSEAHPRAHKAQLEGQGVGGHERAKAGESSNAPGNAPSQVSAIDRVASRSRTELVDARPKAPQDSATPGPNSIIAEWFGEGSKSAPSHQRIAEALSKAGKSAEQAIEDRAVPRRFNSAIERYFQRLPSALAPTAGEPTPATPAKDAP